MKNNFFITLFFLTGCAGVSTDIKELKYNEVLGSKHSEFDGRIFSASCSGNEYADAGMVKEECLSKMAETVYNKGYNFFTVITQDGKTTESLESYTTTQPITSYHYGYGEYRANTTYVPQYHSYTVTKFHKFYTFVLIDEKDIDKWGNYYKVSDYYTPKTEK